MAADGIDGWTIGRPGTRGARLAEALPEAAVAHAREGPHDAGFPDGPRLTIAPSRASPGSWDAFAQGCDASFWSSWSGARMWQLKLHAAFRLRRFDVLLNPLGSPPRKIGQCAVGIGGRLRVVSDGLVLQPEYAHLWHAAMLSLLGHLGPGRYVYGSFWSTEAPRHRTILSVPGTRVVAARRLVVEAIDLRRVERWPDFLGRISRNVVRNAKRFGQAHADRRFIDRRGARCLTLLWPTIRLRTRMYDRKSLAFSGARAGLNYVLRSLMLRSYVAVRVSRVGRRFVASAGTVAFGKSVCFLDGASAEHPAGAGWDVLLSVIEDAHGSGYARFLLGYTDVPEDFAGQAWQSPVRYRRDCRAEAIETSLFAFDFAVERTDDPAVPPLLLDRTEPRWTGDAQS